MFPNTDLDRTIMPRTTPCDFTTRNPGKSKVVVVKGCVWLMPGAFKQIFSVSGKLNFGFVSRFGRRSSWERCEEREVKWCFTATVAEAHPGFSAGEGRIVGVRINPDEG